MCIRFNRTTDSLLNWISKRCTLTILIRFTVVGTKENIAASLHLNVHFLKFICSLIGRPLKIVYQRESLIEGVRCFVSIGLLSL